MTVAVLFARRDSIYKQIGGCDVFDIDRDARTWSGGSPVVAHPPCRAWGRLRAFAKPRHDEKALAHFAVECVREFGGVLEHPEASTLWLAAGLPNPREGKDVFGGWTLCVDQSAWGHAARKRTWLYVVGVSPAIIPPLPMPFGYASASVETISKADREHTPEAFARWLLDLARTVSICNKRAA